MPPLARQQWPRPTTADPIVGRPVFVLTVSILVVATPDRARRGIRLQQVIDDFEAALDKGIVWAPQAQPHQLQEIRTDLFAGSKLDILRNGCGLVRFR
jgi:hypothetical protein